MTAVYQLKIKYVQDKFGVFFLDAKRPVSSALEDKHLHEHRKNVLTWCISMYHVVDLKQTRSIKNVTLESGKKSTGVAVYWEE